MKMNRLQLDGAIKHHNRLHGKRRTKKHQLKLDESLKRGLVQEAITRDRMMQERKYGEFFAKD